MKNILIANWKMKQSLKQAEEFARKIKNKKFKNLELVVGPSHVHLPTVTKILKSSSIKVAAQNMHFAENGAYTGEISAEMLQSVGVNTVILGHSERREYFNEDDNLLKQKVDKALEVSVKQLQSIKDSSKKAPLSFSGYDKRIKDKEKTVDKLLKEITAVIFTQEKQIERQALISLKQRYHQIQNYLHLQ